MLLYYLDIALVVGAVYMYLLDVFYYFSFFHVDVGNCELCCHCFDDLFRICYVAIPCQDVVHNYCCVLN